MLRRWITQQELPAFPVLMPNVFPVDERVEVPKLKTLQKLEDKVRIVGAWGNSVSKDIRPYLLTGVETVHHLSWWGSTESAFPRIMAELLNHPHYHLVQTIPHEHKKSVLLKGENKELRFAAVESVIRLHQSSVVAQPACPAVTCGATNPPDDDKPKPIVVNGLDSLSTMAMRIVAGQDPGIWPLLFWLVSGHSKKHL